ncbi:MAG: haloacid dehalogenase type II [Actinomycetota bacterium]|nr:haloacid dehalogenase type II [Actinomycetota bacterium]
MTMPSRDARPPTPKSASGRVQALAFDVFGTVVDWRASIIQELEDFARQRNLTADCPAFADAWRSRYAPSMDRVRRGEIPWTNLDGLHRSSLEELLTEFGVEGLSEADKEYLNHAWHRLAPWPDAVEGLTRLKERFTITTLSNGNLALLTNMAKRGGLPWDAVLSAELVQHYKPDAEAYLMVPELLDLHPEQVMLVAAHPDDLRAARDNELKTAYVHRPLEFGPGKEPERPGPEFDLTAEDFLDLAVKLDA